MYKQSATYNNYMQDPTCQQGFNRYAYCAYNPLKYVDPSGEQYFGWYPGIAYQMEQEARLAVLKIWQQTYDSWLSTHISTLALAKSIYSQGDEKIGNGGSGNHGSGIGKVVDCEAHTTFDRSQRNVVFDSDHGRCVYASLGSMRKCWGIPWGPNTKQWESLGSNFGDEAYLTNNLAEFLKANKYECTKIGLEDICDAMNDGYVVSAMCVLDDNIVSLYGFDNACHYVNISDCIMFSDGTIQISFDDFSSNTFMEKYSQKIEPANNTYRVDLYKTYHCCPLKN